MKETFLQFLIAKKSKIERECVRDPKNSIFNDFEAEKKILPSLPLDQLCAQFIAEIDF
jgi:hypothetical protein